MKQATSLASATPSRESVWLAAGVFDGLHRGHQAVLNCAIYTAAEGQGEAWALTFEPHPLEVLRPQHAPPRLTTPTEKLKALSDMKLDGCITLPFTDSFSHLEPEKFIVELLNAIPFLKGIMVGPDWRFGHQARGDVILLYEQAAQYGFSVSVAEPVSFGGKRISSTRIREALAAGRFREVANLLGRPYGFSGTVIHGRQIGRDLGFPTANLVPPDKAMPPYGVHAVHAHVAGETYHGATYYGECAGKMDRLGGPAFEVHLLDVDDDLYNEHIQLDLLEFIRPDKQFISKDALRQQIKHDIEAVRSALD